jgi:hypothetical protein
VDSANIFAADWSTLARVGLVVGFIGVALCVGFAVRRLQPTWLRTALFLLFVGGASGAAFSIPLPQYVGEPRTLYRMRGALGERLIVHTHFSSSGGSARSSRKYEHNYLLAFELSGYREIGRLALPVHDPIAGRLEIRGWRGRWACITSPEGFWIVDGSAAKLVVRQRDRAEALLAARDRLGFDPEEWGLALLRAGARGDTPRDGVEVEQIQSARTCSSIDMLTQPPDSRSVAGLRAIPVRSAGAPCRFGTGSEAVRLFLHRGTPSRKGPSLFSAHSRTPTSAAGRWRSPRRLPTCSWPRLSKNGSGS